MKITLEMIKILRQKTQAGMLSCKKALEKTEGNIDKAILLLKQEGLIKATKKEDRIALEGLTNVFYQGNKAFLFELNAETDFVVRNEHFINLYQQLTKILLKTDDSIKTLDDFYDFVWQGQSVRNLLLEKIDIIKEKITLSRLQIVHKKDHEFFGTYKHQGGKVSVLVILNKDCVNVAEELSIQVAGFNPKFISKKTTDPFFVSEKKKMFLKQTIEEQQAKNKKTDDSLLAKIVDMRMDAFLNEICLLEQTLYSDNSLKIKEYLKKNDVEILFFVRFAVNETI